MFCELRLLFLLCFPAREELEVEHYGMDKVKKRVLEFLAVRQLKKDMKGWSWREEGGCSDSSWWNVTESVGFCRSHFVFCGPTRSGQDQHWPVRCHDNETKVPQDIPGWSQ